MTKSIRYHLLSIQSRNYVRLNSIIRGIGGIPCRHDSFIKCANRPIAVVTPDAKDNRTLLLHRRVALRAFTVKHRLERTLLRISDFNRPMVTAVAFHHRGDELHADDRRLRGNMILPRKQPIFKIAHHPRPVALPLPPTAGVAPIHSLGGSRGELVRVDAEGIVVGGERRTSIVPGP